MTSCSASATAFIISTSASPRMRKTASGMLSSTTCERSSRTTGAKDTESFSIRINPPRPVVITNQTDQLSPGTVGRSYCCGNLFADGGVPGYTWTLRAGALPPGLRLTASPGRITGTPTTAGTFSFTVRVTDSRGAFAERRAQPGSPPQVPPNRIAYGVNFTVMTSPSRMT